MNGKMFHLSLFGFEISKSSGLILMFYKKFFKFPLEVNVMTPNCDDMSSIKSNHVPFHTICLMTSM